MLRCVYGLTYADSVRKAYINFTKKIRNIQKNKIKKKKYTYIQTLSCTFVDKIPFTNPPTHLILLHCLCINLEP
jgi:hypothetical protein